MPARWEKHYSDRVGCSIIYIVIVLIALAVGWVILEILIALQEAC